MTQALIEVYNVFQKREEIASFMELAATARKVENPINQHLGFAIDMEAMWCDFYLEDMR